MVPDQAQFEINVATDAKAKHERAALYPLVTQQPAGRKPHRLAQFGPQPEFAAGQSS
jgi:hypothetical protein